MDERLQTLYDEAGRPGARVFRTFARRKGENITSSEAQQFVAKQSTAQVFQAKLPSDGKVTASREDMRFMADLMDFSKRRQQPGGHKYALVVVDVFSKFVWIERLLDKESSTILQAYRKIIARNGHISPKEVSTDLGNEFFGPGFQAYLKDHGTTHRSKNVQQINSIATVDRAIQSIKSILASLQANSKSGWSELVKKATDIYNDREHGALYGQSPEEVSDDKPVLYELEAQAGKDIKHNNDMWRKKAGKLKDLGFFRKPLPRRTWNRIDQPRFSGEVHEVKGLVGANVTSQDGETHPVRQVLAVPSSADIDVNLELTPGSGKREKQLHFLKPFAEMLKAELRGAPPNGMTFARATQFLRTRPACEDTAEAYQLKKTDRYVKFLRLFNFIIDGSGPSMRVRAQTRGSSSSTGRPSGSVDIVPRALRNAMSAATSIAFTPDNPFRGGSAAYTRYGRYKDAITVGEARTAGMTPQDLQVAISRGVARLT